MTFKTGISGNPNGRPLVSATREQLRQSIKDEMPSILKMVIDKAKDGDMHAAKILIDRAIPALKPVAEPTGFVVAGNDKLVDMGRTVLDMTSRGELSTDEAIGLMKVLSAYTGVVVDADKSDATERHANEMKAMRLWK